MMMMPVFCEQHHIRGRNVYHTCGDMWHLWHMQRALSLGRCWIDLRHCASRQRIWWWWQVAGWWWGVAWPIFDVIIMARLSAVSCVALSLSPSLHRPAIGSHKWREWCDACDMMCRWRKSIRGTWHEKSARFSSHWTFPLYISNTRDNCKRFTRLAETFHRSMCNQNMLPFLPSPKTMMMPNAVDRLGLGLTQKCTCSDGDLCECTGGEGELELLCDSWKPPTSDALYNYTWAFLVNSAKVQVLLWNVVTHFDLNDFWTHDKSNP